MMNKKKYPRKYKIARYAAMWGDYYVGKMIRVPLTLVFIYLTFAGVGSAILGCVTLFDWLSILMGCSRPIPIDLGGTCSSAAIFLFFALISDYILYRVIRAYVKLPKGHLLNPLPPPVNEALPEAEVLVRASTPADPATLLRAASGKQTDDAPAVLLRAVNSETVE